MWVVILGIVVDGHWSVHPPAQPFHNTSARFKLFVGTMLDIVQVEMQHFAEPETFQHHYTWDLTETSLAENLDRISLTILSALGMCWKSNLFHIQHTWNIFVFLSSSYIFLLFLVALSEGTAKPVAVIYVTPVFAQVIGFAFAMMQAYHKMTKKALRLELPYYRRSTLLCVLVVIACVLTGAYFLALLRTGYYAVPDFVAVLAQSFIVGGSLAFLVVDAKVSASMVDFLHCQLENGSLNSEIYDKIGNEIESRVKSYSVSGNVIMVVAMLDMLFLFIFSLFLPLKYMFIPAAMLLREMIYVAVGFWYVAIVNEKADNLTRSIGSMQTSDDPEKRILKHELYICANSKPISFTLSGMRLKRKDVIFRLSVWLLGFVLGLLKEVISKYYY